MEDPRAGKTLEQISFEEETWSDDYDNVKEELKERYRNLKSSPKFKEEDFQLRNYPLISQTGIVLLVVCAVLLAYGEKVILMYSLFAYIVILHIAFSLYKSDFQNSLVKYNEVANKRIDDLIDEIYYFQTLEQEKDDVLKKQVVINTFDNKYTAKAVANPSNRENDIDIKEDNIEDMILYDDCFITNHDGTKDYSAWMHTYSYLLLTKLVADAQSKMDDLAIRRIAYTFENLQKKKVELTDFLSLKGFTENQQLQEMIIQKLNTELFIRSIEEEIKSTFKHIPFGERGAIQWYWAEKKKYLKEKYNIDWLSQQDLQPEIEYF